MEDQILDFTPIVNPTSTTVPTPKKVEGVNPNDYFNNIKGKYSPIRIQESDLGKFAGQDLSESSLKRYYKGDQKLESEFALTQSVGDRMLSSMKIAGANIAATSLGILAEIPDMLSTGEVFGENAPIANGLFDWRNEVQKQNTPYETFYDKENPFKSILLPGFLTGSSKGWGTILETAGYGIGAGLGIAAQEAAVTLLTGGTGSIPALAKGIAKLVKLSDNTRKLAQYIEEGSTAIKNIDTALDISKAAYKEEKLGKFLEKGFEVSKDIYKTLAMSYSEAQMEALEGKNNYIEQQKLNFKNTFGYEPLGKDLEEINKKSSDVYQGRFLANMFLLSATNAVSNKIFFGGLDKLKQGLNKFTEEGIEGTLDKLGNLTFSDNAFKLATTNKWWEKGFGKGLKAGVEIGVNALKKTPLALSEGVEEGGQFIIDKATNNYFGFDYNKPHNANLLNSIKDATSELFTSVEGQQSMLLGILGGTGQQMVGNIAQFIGDKTLTGREGYVPLKERKELRLKELNTLTNLYNTPEAQAVNVNSVFGTLDNKFKNTSQLLAASGALDVVLGNKELERRTSNSIAFQHFTPFVQRGMEDVLSGMFKYRVDAISQEEWDAAGIKQSKSEVLNNFNSKLKDVKEAHKLADKINPYKKDTQDYKDFENFKGNYAFTLFQVQSDVKEGEKIKQLHSKYFDVLSKFANKNVIKDGRSFLNTKTKEYKDRLELLEQAESSEFTKIEKKRVKKLLENYQELKDKFSPIGLKKEEYAKLLDELILTTNFEYNLQEDTNDLSEQISDIQDYLSIQDRIKSNLADIKLMQGGGWEDVRKFIKTKQKEAETLGEKQAEIIKTETPTPEPVVSTPVTPVVTKPTTVVKPTVNKPKEGIDRTEELQDYRNQALNEAITEVNEKRKVDFQNITEDKDKENFNNEVDAFFTNNALQTKEDFVQALNELLDKFIEEKKTPEVSNLQQQAKKIEKDLNINLDNLYFDSFKTLSIGKLLKGGEEESLGNREIPTKIIGYDLGKNYFAVGFNGASKGDITFYIYQRNNEDYIFNTTKLGSNGNWTRTDVQALNGVYASKIKSRNLDVNYLSLLAEKLKQLYNTELNPLEKKPVETPVKTNPTPEVIISASKARVSFMVGMESPSVIGQNYKKALQEAIAIKEPMVEIGEERPMVKEILDQRLIINTTVEKPVLFKGKEIGTIYPSSAYKVKDEYKNTDEGKELQALIDKKDELYNSKEATVENLAYGFNTKDPYVSISIESSKFTTFKYYSKGIDETIIIDKVILEKTVNPDGTIKYELIDNLGADVKLESGEIFPGLKDRNKRDIVRKELIQEFINSKSLYKDVNQYFIFMIGKSNERGQIINIQPINIINVTEEATKELESFFDGDLQELDKLLKFDKNNPDKYKGWNDEYALIDTSKYNDMLKNVGTPEKAPDIKVYVNGKDNKINSLSLEINKKTTKIFRDEKDGEITYRTASGVFPSMKDLLKSLAPKDSNYELRKKKLPSQEREHDFAKKNFRVGESSGRVYLTQQFILTPIKSETKKTVETKVEMKPEPVKTPEPILVKQEVEVKEKGKLESIIGIKNANLDIKVEITPEIIAETVKMVNEEDLNKIYENYLSGDIKEMKSYLLKPVMLQSIIEVFDPKEIKDVPSMRNISIEEKLQEYLTTCK